MKNKLFDKYDFIFIFIIVFSLIIFLQSYFNSPHINSEATPMKVVVEVPLVGGGSENINTNDLGYLYFGNSNKLSRVSNISKTDKKLIVTFEGNGIYEDGSKVFSGQNININDRIKISGGISGDAYVVQINKTK